MNIEWFHVATLLWPTWYVFNHYVRPRLPLRARIVLGDVDIHDPRMVEEIKAAYVSEDVEFSLYELLL